VCPGTPRLLAMGTAQTPGRAAAVYNDIKVAKCGDQSNFVPFIVETGGRINAAGLDFFDTVSGALEGDTAKVRACPLDSPRDCFPRRRSRRGRLAVRRQGGSAVRDSASA
jgi:hypothetical protein